ncbi:MAG: type II toxin-antitoxin system antitoxin SocA domain-containing protein [Candidatus Paceibacterota bacterium]|jgi:transcriptional regulator with XRE-family HTH domain
MIGQFILNQRKKRNITQESLASLLNISRPTYVQIEQGERDLTVTEAQKLSEVFDISLEDLLKGKEFQEPKFKIEEKKSKVEKEEVRISVPQEKIEKFRQVLLYILKKVGGKPNVGMTAIYKFLYFIDFDYYEKYEEQLMGLNYIKNHYGPTPLLFDNLIKKMIKDGEVETVKSKFYQYPQTKYLVNPEVEPDLTVLDGKEKEHIDFELQRLSDMTAIQLSDLSHKDVPWISAENGKSINYESVFYRTSDTSLRDYGESD